jgi:hypothetical protein
MSVRLADGPMIRRWRKFVSCVEQNPKNAGVGCTRKTLIEV